MAIFMFIDATNNHADISMHSWSIDKHVSNKKIVMVSEGK